MVILKEVGTVKGFLLGFAVMVVALAAIPAFAQEQFRDSLVKMGIEVGARYGTGYLRGFYGTKIADITYARYDSEREREEIRMTFRMWPQHPTGHEKVALGLDARSYPEIGPQVDVEGASGRNSRISFCGSYRVGDHGIVYLDVPVASMSDGVRWYPRVVVEDVGVRVSRRLYLTADLTADADPEVGFKGSLNLEWRTDSVKLKLGTSSSSVAVGSGFNF